MRYRFVKEFDSSNGKWYWSTECRHFGFLWVYVPDSLTYDEAGALERYRNILRLGHNRRKRILEEAEYIG